MLSTSVSTMLRSSTSASQPRNSRHIQAIMVRSFFSSSSQMVSGCGTRMEMNRNNAMVLYAQQRPLCGADYAKIIFLSKRCLSNYSNNRPTMPSSQPQRASPIYSVPGEVCTLQVKFMAPGFKAVGASNLLVTDTSRRGRLLLEFCPRSSEGTVLWNQSVRFGLSAEEVGLFVNQLPNYPIELARSTGKFGNQEDGSGGGGIGGDHPGGDNIDKVLKIEPGESGTVKFTIDFLKDGVGGQEMDGLQGPLAITVEAGEFEVIAAIFKETLTTLIGWKQLVDRSIEQSIAEIPARRPMRDGGNNVPF